MPEKQTEKFLFIVTESLANQRLDKVVSTHEKIQTRSKALKLFQLQYIKSEKGELLKPSYITKINEKIEIEIPIEIENQLMPLDLPLNVVFEDESLLVINKPSGLVVHPACGHLQDTLVNALIHHTNDLSMGFHEKRPGIVHRLDKDTSGLIVVAKNDEAQRFLAMQFQNKSTHRVYYAIAFGPFKKSSGVIKSYLRRHPENRMRVASVEDESLGKLAITHFKVTQTHASNLSLVELKLETGRTHQIRAHLSEMGNPIVGDEVYGGVKRIKNLKSVQLRSQLSHLNRFALHAAELGFIHPLHQKKLLFKAPWPDELKELAQALNFPMLEEKNEKF